MSKITFEEKVRSMSAYEIVMALVNGLKNPIGRIQMNTFGELAADSVCYGCGATYAIANIAGLKEFTQNEKNTGWDYQVINCDPKFLENFEVAIDSLRQGNIQSYNTMAIDHGFALIADTEEKLPYLTTSSYMGDLPAYEALALRQDGAPT